LASAAYLDQDYAAQTWEKVRRSRRELREGLIGLGLTVPISQANFVLAHVPLESPLPALQIYQRLKDRNILVRHFGASGLDEQLRITVGTPAENAALLVALEELLR
ncbi:MAG: aminotransferase class I/II-fold pyridoxal phosphate-dependent enzyme, partial [Gammaproteobacteria bacterium]|nr:aminotransferase class I/II-fold pyridoxal phosphate-dependent enzyme [Gammaproteobacteria bacterium]